MLIVCYANIDMLWHNVDWQPYLDKLPPTLQNRICAYKDAHQQQLRLTGKLLLNHILQNQALNYSTAQLKYTIHNKPYFPNSGFDFSITHSGSIVLCAFSDKGNIGIDAEEIKPVDIQLYKDVFSPREWNALQNVEHREKLFYDYWTKKEAILKAMGVGISDNMNTLEATSSNVKTAGKEWHLLPVNLDINYAINIAVDILDHGVHIVEFSLYNIAL